ncbi:hypothetical protein KC19_8G022400 [Ceratodon purpureus]|uniref:Uncharacterized protein n=1 Tax=Ceratodon purpureus TaxID=3225 RepID=A0A8T0GWB9_CERPU|nr:hypothetical protein KC19_8G022400 [Ceratodon purpureus]
MSTSGDGRSLGLSEDLSRLSVRDDEAPTSGIDKSMGMLPQTGPRSKDEISDLKKSEVLKQQLGSSNAETNDVEKEDEVVKKEKAKKEKAKKKKAKKKNKDVKKKNKDQLQSDEAPTSGIDKSMGMLPQTGPRSKDEISDFKELEVVKQQPRSSDAETNDVGMEGLEDAVEGLEDAVKRLAVLKKKLDAKKNEDAKLKIGLDMLAQRMFKDQLLSDAKIDEQDLRFILMDFVVHRATLPSA